jgi:hypothetical protein
MNRKLQGNATGFPDAFTNPAYQIDMYPVAGDQITTCLCDSNNWAA